MEDVKRAESVLQWHPAFFSGIQIELCKEEGKVSFEYPRKLIGHLTEVRGFSVELFEAGIYYIKGDIFPIQVIVTSRLSKAENFWLRNLTDDLPDRAAVEELAREYHEHRKNTLYRSVMNVIVKANEELFEEESDVCEAIIDLFRDEYDKGVEEAKQQGVQQGILEAAKKML